MLKSNDVLRDILLAHPDNDEACRALIDAANAAGGADNISVVIVEVLGDPGETGEVPVVVERAVERSELATDEPDAQGKKRRFAVPRLALVAAGAVVLLLVMAVVYFAGGGGSGYVVSTRGGVVVLLDGRAGADTRSAAEGEVVERFPGERLDEFPTPTQRQLRRGYEVDSLEEGRDLVRGLPHRQVKPTASPKPSPSASPDAKATEDPGASETP
jgi:hypothetical protein